MFFIMRTQALDLAKNGEILGQTFSRAIFQNNISTGNAQFRIGGSLPIKGNRRITSFCDIVSEPSHANGNWTPGIVGMTLNLPVSVMDEAELDKHVTTYGDILGMYTLLAKKHGSGVVVVIMLDAESVAESVGEGESESQALIRNISALEKIYKFLDITWLDVDGEARSEFHMSRAIDENLEKVFRGLLSSRNFSVGQATLQEPTAPVCRQGIRMFTMGTISAGVQNNTLEIYSFGDVLEKSVMPVIGDMISVRSSGRGRTCLVFSANLGTKSWTDTINSIQILKNSLF